MKIFRETKIFKSKILEGEGCWELLSALREGYEAWERDEGEGKDKRPEDNGIESEEEDGELEFVLWEADSRRQPEETE